MEKQHMEKIVGEWPLVCENGLWSWGSTPLQQQPTEKAVALLQVWQIRAEQLISSRLKRGFKADVDHMIQANQQIILSITEAISFIQEAKN